VFFAHKAKNTTKGKSEDTSKTEGTSLKNPGKTQCQKLPHECDFA
jgi:hypothetical protein